MTELIPVLNDGRRRPKVAKKKKKVRSSARRPASKRATSKKVTSRKSTSKKITSKKATSKKARRKRSVIGSKYAGMTPSARSAAAITDAVRASRRKAGKSPYTRAGGWKLTWAEAAASSGAVYPKTFPKGHPKAGQADPRAGRVMSRDDALRYQRPVVGYLPRQAIKEYYSAVMTGGKIDKKKVKAGTAVLAKWDAGLKQLRKKHGSEWLRTPLKYTRGKKKGQRKPDFTQGWSGEKGFKKGAWQVGAGPHLAVKFRRGRGPTTSVKLTRGFSPSQDLTAMLEAGGFGGYVDAPGGRMKLNSSRRRTSRKGKRRTAKSRVGSNPRRRKGAKVRRRKNPGAKKIVAYNGRKRRRKSKVRKNPGHSLRRKGGRRRRKNPGHQIRKNPGAAQMTLLRSQDFWLGVLHVGIGISGTAMLGGMLQRAPLLDRLAYASGNLGVAGRAAINLLGAGILSAGAYALRKQKFVGETGYVSILVGGAAFSVLNALAEATGNPLFPRISVPAAGGMSGLGSYNRYDPLLRHGSYPGQYPGMGSVMSPEDLVAGESLARNVNEFSGMGDWMELSGAPVPLEDIRGLSGMNDWVEFNQSAGLVQQGFDPGAENF